MSNASEGIALNDGVDKWLSSYIVFIKAYAGLGEVIRL